MINMKTKVLFVASEFASGMIPFASKIITTLSKNINYEVYAIVVNSGNKSYNTLLSDVDPNHLITIEYPQNKFFKLIYKFYPYTIIKTINRFDKLYNPDIIHFLTGDFTLAPYYLIKKPKNNVYYTVHDLYSHEVRYTSLINCFLHKYVVWGYKLLRDRIENLTTSSVAQFEELKRLYPNKHVSFTHFPSLLTRQIQNGNKQVGELVDDDKYILFFGTVDEYKGVDLLINAYKKSTLYNKNKLVIAGKGLPYDDLIAGSTNIIRINRFIEDSEIKDLFTKAALVVYPYRSATMSGVLSIAYYFNKIVLLSSIPFFIDNATSNSVFFEVGNIVDLQKKIEALLTMKMELSNDHNCYKKIYSDDTLIFDYNKLYLQK